MVVIGSTFGKIKAMYDDKELPTKHATPATPVEILGLSQVAQAGDTFKVFKDEHEARLLAEKNTSKSTISGGKAGQTRC